MRKLLLIIVYMVALSLPTAIKAQDIVLLFSLGFHTDDDKAGMYTERYDQWIERYIRIYGDGCVMSFFKDRNGGIHQARWEAYNHCVAGYG